MSVDDENFVMTTGFDCTAKARHPPPPPLQAHTPRVAKLCHPVQVHDVVTGNGVFGVENQRKVRYTGVAWHGGTKARSALSEAAVWTGTLTPHARTYA